MDGAQAHGVHMAGHDAQVGPAVAHAAGNVGVGAFLQVDVHPRMGGQELGQQFGQEIRHRRGVGEHAQPPAQAGAKLQQVGAQLLGLAQHGAGVAEEGLARRREPHAARLAVEQGQAHAVFQRLDAHAGRRQRQVLARGGAGDGTVFGATHEQAQVGEVELHGGAA